MFSKKEYSLKNIEKHGPIAGSHTTGPITRVPLNWKIQSNGDFLTVLINRISTVTHLMFFSFICINFQYFW